MKTFISSILCLVLCVVSCMAMAESAHTYNEMVEAYHTMTFCGLICIIVAYLSRPWARR